MGLIEREAKLRKYFLKGIEKQVGKAGGSINKVEELNLREQTEGLGGYFLANAPSATHALYVDTQIGKHRIMIFSPFKENFPIITEVGFELPGTFPEAVLYQLDKGWIANGNEELKASLVANTELSKIIKKWTGAVVYNNMTAQYGWKLQVSPRKSGNSYISSRPGMISTLFAREVGLKETLPVIPLLEGMLTDRGPGNGEIYNDCYSKAYYSLL